MLLQGKVGDAIVRVIESVFGVKLPKELSDLIHKFTSDEGKVIWSAAGAAVADVVSGKPMDQVAGDVVVTLSTQGVQVAKSDVMDALGLQVRSAQKAP